MLSKYQPRIIKSEEENEIFLEIVEELISRKNLNPEEEALLELLVKLIEDFEDSTIKLIPQHPVKVAAFDGCSESRRRGFIRNYGFA